ncbi:MAG: RNA methyltransferase [Bacteroidales bacterium]|nr:RNA methyltransferase [Bacteroidales bacterium]
MAKKLSTQEMNRLSVEEFRESRKLPLVVVLDNVRSMNNIGSVFRTSDAFRVAQIVLCGITATPPHRDIHKTALGAEDAVSWQYENDTLQCVHRLQEQGYTVYAVEQAQQSTMLNGLELPEGARIAIVFGNEVDGVQQEVVDACHGCIEIPQQGTKHSLNVSCAAAIVLWEMYNKLQQCLQTV